MANWRQCPLVAQRGDSIEALRRVVYGAALGLRQSLGETMTNLGYLAAQIAVGVLLATGARAETHIFVPTQFYNTYSFAHPPALHIKSGDRVLTKTIDAGGVDWNGKQVAPRANPETGPFYIDGAEPGDVIVV